MQQNYAKCDPHFSKHIRPALRCLISNNGNQYGYFRQILFISATWAPPEPNLSITLPYLACQNTLLNQSFTKSVSVFHDNCDDNDYG